MDTSNNDISTRQQILTVILCIVMAISVGSVYCDVQLRLAGFNGEEIRSGSVLAVKTHKSTFSWTNATLPTFDRKVRMVCKSYHVFLL